MAKTVIPHRISKNENGKRVVDLNKLQWTLDLIARELNLLAKGSLNADGIESSGEDTTLTITNNFDNYVITATGGTVINGESTLQNDGTHTYIQTDSRLYFDN